MKVCRHFKYFSAIIKSDIIVEMPSRSSDNSIFALVLAMEDVNAFADEIVIRVFSETDRSSRSSSSVQRRLICWSSSRARFCWDLVVGFMMRNCEDDRNTVLTTTRIERL